MPQTCHRYPLKFSIMDQASRKSQSLMVAPRIFSLTSINTHSDIAIEAMKLQCSGLFLVRFSFIFHYHFPSYCVFFRTHTCPRVPPILSSRATTSIWPISASLSIALSVNRNRCSKSSKKFGLSLNGCV